MWYVGMDVHLKSSSVCVLNEQGCRVVQKMIRGPWPKLVEWLKDLEEPFAVCYEGSSGYGPLHDRLVRMAERVEVVHPGHLHRYPSPVSFARPDESPVRTRLALRDIGCVQLERDLAVALVGRWRNAQAEPTTPPPDANLLFRASLEEVIRAVQMMPRFALLKQFVVHGSLLPSWDTKSKNSQNPLRDDELLSCVNFITGHMVTKFQGALAEILAWQALDDLTVDLQAKGDLARGGSLVFGDAIRCRSPRGSGSVKGPDALYVRVPPNGMICIHSMAEIKSGYVPPARLDRQSGGHLAALRRGISIDGKSYESRQIDEDDRLLVVYVAPSSWLMSRRFHFEPTADGRRLVMDGQDLPPITTPSPPQVRERVCKLTLAWSHDALRAAAFQLTHGYMAEVGEALAAEGLARTDMSPGDAGMNDLLHQLHIAIFRQQEVEPNKERREKTIELYNVLGFGWALGHHFRDEDGDITMLYPEDLDRRHTMGL